MAKLTLFSTEYVEAIYVDGRLVESGKRKWDLHQHYLEDLAKKYLAERGIELEDIYFESDVNYEDVPKDLDELEIEEGLTYEEVRMINEGMV